MNAADALASWLKPFKNSSRVVEGEVRGEGFLALWDAITDSPDDADEPHDPRN